MTTTEDRDRRKDDVHLDQKLEWDTVQPLIDAALAHLVQERIASAATEIPSTDPQQFIAIGTAIEIGGLLPEGFGTSAAGQAALAAAPAAPADPMALEQAKENAVQQAQTWAQEARSQRTTVLSILRYFGMPEHDWEALRLISEKIATPMASTDAVIEAKPDLEQLMMEKRIELIPEYEGEWRAYVYGDSDEPQATAAGRTPSIAVEAALRTPAAVAEGAE